MDMAIQKLYAAFHDGELKPNCCLKCAVGNICNNRDFWRHFTDVHGSLVLNYTGQVNEAFGRKFYGYSPSELIKIEYEFLQGCGYLMPIDKPGMMKRTHGKDELFIGLSKVIALLCELDGIPNVMDCSAIFNYVPVRQPRFDRMMSNEL